MSLYFTIAELASLENLALAARAARRGKSRRPDVDDYHRREESHLLTLREALLNGTWRPGEYREFTVHEPKRRLICAAPYADRVAHHALCRMLEPLLARRFIARSFSCQKGNGTTAARECVRKLVSRHRDVLKCDILKFFESIAHEILLDRPALRPRVLGATKRRFEARRRRLARCGDIARLGVAVRSRYPVSCEGNSEGLRRVWSRPQRT